jgi:hypothetical protein
MGSNDVMAVAESKKNREVRDLAQDEALARKLANVDRREVEMSPNTGREQWQARVRALPAAK